MKGASDILPDVVRQRVIVGNKRGKIHFAVGQRGEDRGRKRRDGVDERGNGHALDLVGWRDAVEPPQSVVELDRKCQPRDGAHHVMRQDFHAAAKARHETLQIELVAGEIEFDQRMNRGIGCSQRDPAAGHRFEQRWRQIRDLMPERTPRGLALHVDIHVRRWRVGQPGRIAKSRHRVRPDAVELPRAGLLQKADEDNGVVRQVVADRGQIGARFNP